MISACCRSQQDNVLLEQLQEYLRSNKKAVFQISRMTASPPLRPFSPCHCTKSSLSSPLAARPRVWGAGMISHKAEAWCNRLTGKWLLAEKLMHQQWWAVSSSRGSGPCHRGLSGELRWPSTASLSSSKLPEVCGGCRAGLHWEDMKATDTGATFPCLGTVIPPLQTELCHIVWHLLRLAYGGFCRSAATGNPNMSLSSVLTYKKVSPLQRDWTHSS